VLSVLVIVNIVIIIIVGVEYPTARLPLRACLTFG